MKISASENIKPLVFSVYIPTFLFAIAQGLLIPVLPIHAKDTLGANEAMIGMVVAARYLGVMAFDIPAGILISSFGLRKTMIVGIILFALAAIGAALSPTISLLIISRILAGISFSLWSISRHSYIAISVKSSIRGRALSLFGGTTRIGMIIGPILGGILAYYVGILIPFYTQGLIALIILILAIYSTRNLVTESGAFDNSFSVRETVNTFSKYRKDFATLGILAVCIQFLRAAREFIIPVWGDDIGLDLDEIGFITGISYLIDALMFPIAGILMDKFGRKSTAIPSLILLGISLSLIPFSTTYLLLTMVGIIAGIGNGISSGLILTLGSDLSPKNRPGEFLGIWRFISDSGSLIAPLSIGWIATIATLTFASTISSGIAIFGLVIVFFSRETKNLD